MKIKDLQNIKTQTSVNAKKIKSVFYKIYRFIETSATVGLILTLAIFWYQTKSSEQESKKLVENLMHIEQSLSTRYLGIFPDYLGQINNLLKGANPEKPTIIFEDVLYYGILSAPQDFKKMMDCLLKLSQTSHITIVYYDINGSVFRRYIQEARISAKYQGQLSHERNALRAKLKAEGDDNFYQRADSIVSELYLAKTRNDDKAAFEKKVKQYLKPLYDPQTDTDLLYFHIDVAKSRAIDKPFEQITFQDYLKMYQGMAAELIKVLEQHNIELIGINEYLVMSCWLNDGKAVLAFPSKYNTDEIGFFTQDKVFSEYINTMLDGIKEIY